MELWQWVIVICFPSMLIMHTAMDFIILYRWKKSDNDRLEQDKRHGEWAGIFKSIDVSYQLTGNAIIEFLTYLKKQNKD